MRLSDTQRLLMPKAAPLSDVGLIMRRLHIDGPLLVALLLICGFGLFVLYSAVGESNRLLMNQVIRLERRVRRHADRGAAAARFSAALDALGLFCRPACC